MSESGARPFTVRAGARTLAIGGRPWLMGIVNATPDSFSDAGAHPTLEARVALAQELIEAGADIVDVGGESGVTNRPPVEAAEEIERVVPLIARIAGELGGVVSVDTYKPAVAAAAIAAGACIVNDVSGLRDPGLADVCADTRAAPKQKLLDPGYDGRMAEDVTTFLRERMAFATSRGVAAEQLILDPGPDFGKTPGQTVESLRRLDDVHALGRPVLLALSRKDFIGAITGRAPRERGAGTLAALGWGVEAGGHVFRLHDVAAAGDFLAVWDVLSGRRELAHDARLAEDLRRVR